MTTEQHQKVLDLGKQFIEALVELDGMVDLRLEVLIGKIRSVMNEEFGYLNKALRNTEPMAMWIDENKPSWQAAGSHGLTPRQVMYLVDLAYNDNRRREREERRAAGIAQAEKEQDAIANAKLPTRQCEAYAKSGEECNNYALMFVAANVCANHATKAELEYNKMRKAEVIAKAKETR